MYCNPCGDIMQRVHEVTEKGSVTCKGFYCPHCKDYKKAVHRERQLPMLAIFEK